MQPRIRNRSAVRPALEALEDRTVPSVLIPESEPNDIPSAANVLPRVLGTALDIKGSIGAPSDRDWYRIDLERGDVFGAALKAQGDMDPMLHLFDSAGRLVIGNDDALYYGANWLPPESPLPWNHSSIRDPELYCVISAPGTYYLQASTFDDETAGNYKLDVVVARPGLESQPVGTRQVLFFDFDGAVAKAEGVFHDTYTLAPLADSLSGWGLTAADENALIDEILARTTDKLSTFVRANGSNGDYAATGIPGQFDLEIRNSRDDADTFGVDPLVSRMAIGATDNLRLANEMIGLNEYIDVGNFKTDDQSAVAVNFATWLLATYPVQAPATRIDMIAEYVAIIAAHEFAHAVGCWHTDYSTTDPFEGVPTFMDRSFESPLGPDLIFGTADDRTLQLLPDNYHRDEVLTGIQDTLTAYSYGLSTGTRPEPALRAAAVAGETEGQRSGSPQVDPQPAAAVARRPVAGVDAPARGATDARRTDLDSAIHSVDLDRTLWLGPAAPDWSSDPTLGHKPQFFTVNGQGERGQRGLPTVLTNEMGGLSGRDSSDGGEGHDLGERWTFDGVYVGDPEG